MKKDKNDRKNPPSNKEDDVKNLASEPEVSYKKMTLQKFGSFEEMNEADAKAMAQIPPEEHLKNVTELTKRIFKEELKKPMNKRIKFRE